MKQSMRTWVRRWRRRRASKARGGSRVQTRVLAVTLIVLLGGFIWALRYLAPHPAGTGLRLDTVSALAADGRIASATFLDEDSLVQGTLTCARPASKKAPSRAFRCADDTAETETFWLLYPKSGLSTSALIQLMSDAGASIAIDPQVAKGQVRLVTTFLLPLMILANLFALLFSLGRGGGGGIGEVIVFGSLSRGRVRKGKNAVVGFDDVGGADEAVVELREVVDYLRSPERYREIGAMPPKGILMIGPPGCGKTLLAKAAAGEAGVPFFSVAGAEFVESLVGVGAARVRDLFQRVRAVAPALVFIDELDAAGRRRGAGGGGGGTDEREQTLNQLLVEMDGFDASSGIVVIGATNRPDILDPALLRPGRFDRHVTVDQPDRDGRDAILRLHARGRRIAEGVDLATLARRTPGFSGADLANVINEAALLTVRAGKTEIGQDELTEAVERVRSGPQRRGRILTPEERRRAATHEAGHAIVAAALGGAEHIHRVSILSRGRTVGSTSGEVGDESLLTRSTLEERLVTTLAGIAAEETVLGEPSTGSERDLETATSLARDMVARYGMSRRLGRARLLARDSEAFLDAEAAYATMSAATQQQVDEEIRLLLDAGERAAERVLAAHGDVLGRLIEALEAQEHLDGAELTAILETVPRARISLDAPTRNSNARSKRTVRV